MEHISFVNPEAITEAEVLKIFKQFPVDFVRVKDFLNKEPGIREAFLQYSHQYITSFADSVGVELRPNVLVKLQELYLTCLTVGYLTRENLFRSKLDEAMKDKKEGDNGIVTAH